MQTPLAFLKFVARATLNAVGGGVAGDFAVEVVPDVARDVWKWWGKGRPQEQLRAEIGAVAQLSPAEARQQAEQAVAEEAAQQPAAVRSALTAYLSLVPVAIRQSQRRPQDPSGRSLSPACLLREAEDLVPLLPLKRPRFQPGDRPAGIGDWELEELLGVGGFGEVWKARNPHLAERAALKFCLDADAAQALRNEAALLGRVMSQGKHPGIVRLLDTYLGSDPPCLKYEYVAGGDLSGLIQQWHCSPVADLIDQATQVMHQLADIVAFAHRLKPPIVHRDLKPANILVQATEGKPAVRVADFGIGGAVSQQAMGQTRRASLPGELLPTLLRGAHTPLYASPQQVLGQSPDPRDDVHALGVIWYQLLTGHLSIVQMPADWREELAERQVPDGIVRLLGACLAARAERRPADAAVLAEELAKLLIQRGPVVVDPTRVQVKDVQIAPLEVRVEQVRKAQVTTPGLPPLSEDILEMEGRLGGLARVIPALEAGDHPALAPARQAVREAEEQHQRLQDDLKANMLPLPLEQQQQLAAAVRRDPRGSVAGLCDLVPEVSTRVLLPCIHRLRNVERARLALVSAQNQLEQRLRQEVQQLRSQQQELRKNLLARQDEDLRAVLDVFFEANRSVEEFPLEGWMELEPQLEKRRYGLSPRELLRRAEQYHVAWLRKQGASELVPPGPPGEPAARSRSGVHFARLSAGAYRVPEGVEELVNSIGMRFVRIPAGEFLMGSPETEVDRFNDEGPLHSVQIPQAFYLGVYPVTQEKYERVMGTNPSYFTRKRGGGPNHPVEFVEWKSAVEFCRRLSNLAAEQAAGCRYRLPTEAEWEYACRAGTITPFHFGLTASSAEANFHGPFPYGGGLKGPSLACTTAVGSYAPSSWGLYDMHGNVREWCSDWYDEHYYAVSPAAGPTGPATGSSRVTRGGCWEDHGKACRAACRTSFTPNYGNKQTGFRVVLEIDPQSR